MKKLLKKKVNIFGKTVPVFVLVLLGLGLVSAALLEYFGVITGLVTIDQGLLVDGQAMPDSGQIKYSAELTSLDAKMITSGHYLDNQADVDATVYLKTTCTGGGDECHDIPISIDTVGLSTKWSTHADAFADASMTGGIVTLEANEHAEDWSDASEARIVILGEDVGVETLSDLDTMSWNVNVVSGYIAHVDVIVDKDGDGDSDDALVFEAAKVDPSNCELATPYPTEVQDTLGRGIVQGSASAWLSSGASGPGCVETGTFYINTLSNWQSDTGYQEINKDTNVLRFEIEVDGWDQTHDGEVAKSHISNIVINSKNVEIATLTTPVIIEGQSGLAFYVNSKFQKMLVPGTYTITTTVDDTA